MPNVTISLDQPSLDAAKRQAAEDFRSLSQQVAFLVQRDTTRREARKTASKKKGAKAA